MAPIVPIDCFRGNSFSVRGAQACTTAAATDGGGAKV